MVILVFGLPGSGKTYFARHLAEQIKAVHLNSDILRKQIGAWDKYDAASKENVYDVVLEKMQKAVGSKRDVVIDATFYRKKIRDKFINAAEQLQQPWRMIEVRASDNTIRQRVSKPREDSRADYEVYKKIKSEFEPVTEAYLSLCSDKASLQEMMQQATSYLSNA